MDTTHTSSVLSHLAAAIRERRGRRNRSTSEAATAAGCSEVAWRKWEAGERWPGPESLAAIARALGCRPRDLLP